MGLYRVEIEPQFDKELAAAAASGSLAAAAGLIASVLSHEIAFICAPLIFSVALATRLGLGGQSRLRLAAGFAAGILSALALVAFSTRYAVFAAMLCGCLVNAPALVDFGGEKERIRALVCSTLSGYGASLVYAWVCRTGALGSLFPSSVIQMLGGAAFGFVAAAGLLPLFATVRKDGVEQTFRRIEKRLTRKWRENAEQVLERYRRISAFVDTRPHMPEELVGELRDATESASLKALRLIGLLHREKRGYETDGSSIRNEIGATTQVVDDRKEDRLAKEIARCIDFLDRIDLDVTAMEFPEAGNEDYVERVTRLIDLLGAKPVRERAW